MRDAAVVRRGIASCRAALEEHGILLVQDATLPSATTLVTGSPVRGSWWAHEQSHSIFDVLEALEAETTVAKLVARKQTLVHRDRRPELAAIGAEGATWQLDGLRPDARSVVEQVDVAGGAVRSDALVMSGSRARSSVVRDVELRLLLAVGEVHTESGRHAKVLQSWPSWAAETGLRTPLPDPVVGRAGFESVVRGWAPQRIAKLLPWPAEVTP